MLPKAKQYAAAATQTSKLISPPLADTRFVYQNAENGAGLLAGVCRVCLGTEVRMYHMAEHGLSAMYARVVGVQLNTEDKLPPQLCWECVGRMSSADLFIQKALKTQLILTKKITNSGIIISDIESIYRAQHKLKSTLGTKFNSGNECDFLFTEETLEPSSCGNMPISKSANNDCNENIKDIEVDGNEEEQIFIKEELTSEIDPIKYELVFVYDKEEVHNNNTTAYEGAGIDDEQGDTDNENFNMSNEEPAISIKRESASDEEVLDCIESVSEMSQERRRAVDTRKSSAACEGMKQSLKESNNTLSPLRNKKSKTSPGCKKLVVLLEDIAFTIYNTKHSSKQVTARVDQSTKHMTTEKKNVTPLKNRIISESDLNNIREFSADGVDSVELPQSVVNTPGSTRHNINTMHIQKHPKMHYCAYCSYKTYRARDLKVHVNVKHTKNEFFNCPHCSYNAYTKRTLTRHIDAKHIKSVVFKCAYCSYSSNVKRNLSVHINAKHTKYEVFNCPHCSYKAYRKTVLIAHVNTKHTKSEVFKCPHCSYNAYNKSSIANHIYSKHLKNKVFKCPHCSYSSYDRSHIARHKLKHQK